MNLRYFDSKAYHFKIFKLPRAYCSIHIPNYIEFTHVTGYCTYFDTADDRIKGLYAADCSKYETPCPTRYHSTKAFQCMPIFLILKIYKKTHALY